MRIQIAVQFFLVGILFSPIGAQGAFLYLDPADPIMYRGDTVTVSLRLDTDVGECVNVVDAILQYDEGIRAVDVSRGESILNIWVEDPKIDEGARTISFAGGITGGYCGRAAGDPRLTNIIADIIFQSPGFAIGGGDSVSNPSISILDTSSVLLSDGFGTLAPLRTQGAIITLEETPGTLRVDEWNERVGDDRTPPSDFEVALFRDENAFSGSYVISWNTQDKQSGIDHYEVMEEPLEDFYAFRWGRADAPWIETESPYVLKDQTLNSTIRVKALDKAGNETIIVLVPDEAVRSLSSSRIITYSAIGVVAFFSLLLIAYVLVLRKKRIEAIYNNDTSQ